MCGICGIVSLRPGAPVSEKEARGMMEVLVHRGPDDSGVHAGDGVVFGHRRLSIIDLSAAGRQPMSNEDGMVWLTYNGEFYNFAEYVPELKREGHVFRSHTDTEVIIHLYEKHGLEQTLRRMNGMFAFGLWDQARRAVYLVRDHVGIKPLYYCVLDGRVAFASEIKAFFTLPGFTPRLRADRVPGFFLFSEAVDNATLLEGVYRVKPGSYVTIQDGEIREKTYYDLARVPERPDLAEEDALEEFDRVLGRAVRRQMVSDVSLGVFLSGGIDSTILALKAAEIAGAPITTISVAYPEKSANEFFWSDQVAAKIRSRHFKFTVGSGNFFELYPWLTYIYDGPVSTGAAFFKAAQAAKQHCTVMLCGQGSDELFAGYSRYAHADRQARLNRTLKTLLPFHPLRRALAAVLPGLGRGKIFQKAGARLALDDAEIAAAYSGSLARGDFCNLLRDAGPEIYLQLLRSYAAIFPSARNTDFLNKMLDAEIWSGLQRILQQTDRMTMAASVETRVPFLDLEMIEFAFSLPSRLKVRDGVGKYLPKKYLLRHFPAEFVYRKKMGFPTPVFEWFMDPQNPIHSLLDAEAGNDMSDRFNRAYIDRFITEARGGRRGDQADILDPLMGYISFNLWWNVARQSCAGSPPSLPVPV